MMRFVPILYTVVEMIVGGSPERQVVQAGQAQAFAQVFVECVEFLKLLGQRGNLFSRRSPQEHLIAAAYQIRDLGPNQHPGLPDLDLTFTQILKHRTAAITRDQCTRALPLDFKTELFQVAEALVKGPLMRLLVAKEHVYLLSLNGDSP